MSGQTGNIRQELEDSRQRLRDTFDLLEDNNDSEKVSKEIDSRILSKIKPGVEMFHEGIGQVTVLSNPDSKGDVMVQAGIIKLSANAADLKVTKEMKSDIKKKKEGSFPEFEICSSLH